jgi:hypothetical protein
VLPIVSTTYGYGILRKSPYSAHGARQIDQIRRRVLAGERIPHAEKVFSIFQPHTEWISKGQAGVAVELGLRVAISDSNDKQGASSLKLHFGLTRGG